MQISRPAKPAWKSIMIYEVMILGAGPAGMTAAIYSARKNRHTLLLSHDLGGQTNWTAGVADYEYQVLDASYLLEKFYEQTAKYPVTMELALDLQQLTQNEMGIFEAHTEQGKVYYSLSAIAATGKIPQSLGLAREKALRGKGVTYCSTCEGPLFAGQRVAIVGSGRQALSSAVDMTKIAAQVFLVSENHKSAMVLEKLQSRPNFTLLTRAKVKEIEGEDFVEGITIRYLDSGMEEHLAVDGVFIETGFVPGSEPFKDLVSLNEQGEIPIRRDNSTAIPGLYAAGDVTNVPEKQLIVAAGEGAKAALQVHQYLLKEEISREMVQPAAGQLF